MYNMINMISTLLYYIQKKHKRGNPRSSHDEEKIYFISWIVYLYYMIDVH